MIKTKYQTKDRSKSIVTGTATSGAGENDPFANAISPEVFMREVKAIQRSKDVLDINLRNAAADYMKNLHCA